MPDSSFANQGCLNPSRKEIVGRFECSYILNTDQFSLWYYLHLVYFFCCGSQLWGLLPMEEESVPCQMMILIQSLVFKGLYSIEVYNFLHWLFYKGLAPFHGLDWPLHEWLHTSDCSHYGNSLTCIISVLTMKRNRIADNCMSSADGKQNCDGVNRF